MVNTKYLVDCIVWVTLHIIFLFLSNYCCTLLCTLTKQVKKWRRKIRNKIPLSSCPCHSNSSTTDSSRGVEKCIQTGACGCSSWWQLALRRCQDPSSKTTYSRESFRMMLYAPLASSLVSRHIIRRTDRRTRQPTSRESKVHWVVVIYFVYNNDDTTHDVTEQQCLIIIQYLVKTKVSFYAHMFCMCACSQHFFLLQSLAAFFLQVQQYSYKYYSCSLLPLVGYLREGVVAVQQYSYIFEIKYILH